MNDFSSSTQQLKLMIFKNRIADGIPLKLPKIHGKNGFAEISKSLARYRSENNFVCTIKIIVQDVQIVKTFCSFIITFKHST